MAAYYNYNFNDNDAYVAAWFTRQGLLPVGIVSRLDGES